MNREHRKTGAARASALMISSLLATLQCNAVLGIDAARCIGACGDAGATPREETSADQAPSDAGASVPRAAELPRADADSGTGAPRLSESALSGAVDTPLVDEAGECSRGSEPECGVDVCTPGERRCRGKRLELCNAEGTAFMELERCESKASCSADEGCVEDACAPDERRCRRDEL